LPSLYE
jgi:hypothetical protein